MQKITPYIPPNAFNDFITKFYGTQSAIVNISAQAWIQIEKAYHMWLCKEWNPHPKTLTLRLAEMERAKMKMAIERAKGQLRDAKKEDDLCRASRDTAHIRAYGKNYTAERVLHEQIEKMAILKRSAWNNLPLETLIKKSEGLPEIQLPSLETLKSEIVNLAEQEGRSRFEVISAALQQIQAVSNMLFYAQWEEWKKELAKMPSESTFEEIELRTKERERIASEVFRSLIVLKEDMRSLEMPDNPNFDYKKMSSESERALKEYHAMIEKCKESSSQVKRKEIHLEKLEHEENELILKIEKLEQEEADLRIEQEFHLIGHTAAMQEISTEAPSGSADT